MNLPASSIHVPFPVCGDFGAQTCHQELNMPCILHMQLDNLRLQPLVLFDSHWRPLFNSLYTYLITMLTFQLGPLLKQHGTIVASILCLVGDFHARPRTVTSLGLFF